MYIPYDNIGPLQVENGPLPTGNDRFQVKIDQLWLEFPRLSGSSLVEFTAKRCELQWNNVYPFKI